MTDILRTPGRINLSYSIAELPLTLDFSESEGLVNIASDVEAQEVLSTYLQGEVANYASQVETRLAKGGVQGVRTSIHVQGVPFEAQSTFQDILETCSKQSGLTDCAVVFR